MLFADAKIDTRRKAARIRICGRLRLCFAARSAACGILHIVYVKIYKKKRGALKLITRARGKPRTGLAKE